MKRIIEGVTYNTETATLVARYEYFDLEGFDTKAEVFQTRGGAFFRVHAWQQDEKSRIHFEAIEREALDQIVADTDNLEIVDQSILEEPPEATSTSKTDATVFLRVPAALKNRIDAAAKEGKQSTNVFALKCVEQCLAMDEVRKDLVAIWSSCKDLTLLPERFTKDGAVAIACHIEEVAETALARLGVKDGYEDYNEFGYSPSGRFVSWGSREYDHLHEEGWKQP